METRIPSTRIEENKIVSLTSILSLCEGEEEQRNPSLLQFFVNAGLVAGRRLFW